MQYDMVMFFDADVIFTQNCDDLFNTPLDFVGRAGRSSPFNAGVFLIRPSWQVPPLCTALWILTVHACRRWLM